MQPGTKKVLLLVGGIAIVAALYFIPQHKDTTQGDAHSNANGSGFSFDQTLIQAKAQLKSDDSAKVAILEKAVADENPSSLDSLGKYWDAMHQPAVSSYYFEQIAEKNPNEKAWLNAAYRYFDAFSVAGDSLTRSFMVEKAINCYKKVVELNPENLDAKTDLGVCYAEGTSNPMAGITLLKEVVTKNPDHEMAQYNLGVLSMKSGQYEKAVERFEKVLSVKPERTEARYLLSRAYIELGKKDKALANLKIIQTEVNDPKITSEINSLINQINNN